MRNMKCYCFNLKIGLTTPSRSVLSLLYIDIDMSNYFSLTGHCCRTHIGHSRSAQRVPQALLAACQRW